MGLNPNAVGASGQPTTREWTFRDSLQYAVGIGAGADDPFGSELEFTTNNSKDTDHKAFPTQGVVIGFGAGGALSAAGDIDWGKLLHGSQGITVHKPIPTEGTVQITDRIAGMWDKGEGRNAIIDTESSAVDPATGEAMFDLRSSIVIRGSGGFGSTGR